MAFVDSAGAFGGISISAKQFGYAGQAFSDLMGGIGTYLGDNLTAQGDETEAQDYELAAQYAEEEVNVARQNMAIGEYGAERNLALAQGQTKNAVAGGGFAESGSALSILQSNARQGTLQQAVAEVNGESQIAGYTEEAEAYNNMATEASNAASGEKDLGILGAIGGGGGAALNIAAIFAEV